MTYRIITACINFTIWLLYRAECRAEHNVEKCNEAIDSYERKIDKAHDKSLALLNESAHCRSLREKMESLAK
ncbi:hypothetical protein [Aeromonas veronii]|uniref:hypothetical protein n=1 Tax=Aeromonas veronii TaxID=654 RepID=UPI003B9F84E7